MYFTCAVRSTRQASGEVAASGTAATTSSSVPLKDIPATGKRTFIPCSAYMCEAPENGLASRT